MSHFLVLASTRGIPPIIAALLFACYPSSGGPPLQGEVISWGRSILEATNTISELNDVVEIRASSYQSLGLRSDGSLVASASAGRTVLDIPTGLSNVIAIACGGGDGLDFNLALRNNGTVVGWGVNQDGQASPPESLSNVVAIAGGFRHSLALRSDGTVVAWGSNDYQNTNVPSLKDVSAIAAGNRHSLALRSNGTVVVWGATSHVPASVSNGIVAIAAGAFNNLVLRTNGVVISWGDQSQVPPSLTNVTMIAAGHGHNMALRADGTVVCWAENSFGERYDQTNTPTGLTNVVFITAGSLSSLALTSGSVPLSIQRSRGESVLRLHTFFGQSYRTEFSDDLESRTWQHLPGGTFEGTGREVSVSDTSAPEGLPRFYRVVRVQ